MFEKQVKGLIVIFVVLAIIPFIVFFSNLSPKNKIPLLLNQYDNALAVEIQDKDIGSGIYFTKRWNSANQLLELVGSDARIKKDFALENGMKITLHSDSGGNILLTAIDNSRRLALGMPINLNLATKEDLLLIPGIGEKTAQKILILRSEKRRFKNMEEIMETEGIKEKKLAKLKQYLYLQK
jgi:competence protein ComEA